MEIIQRLSSSARVDTQYSSVDLCYCGNSARRQNRTQFALRVFSPAEEAPNFLPRRRRLELLEPSVWNDPWCLYDYDFVARICSQDVSDELTLSRRLS